MNITIIKKWWGKVVTWWNKPNPPPLTHQQRCAINKHKAGESLVVLDDEASMKIYTVSCIHCGCILEHYMKFNGSTEWKHYNSITHQKRIRSFNNARAIGFGMGELFTTYMERCKQREKQLIEEYSKLPIKKFFGVNCAEYLKLPYDNTREMVRIAKERQNETDAET